MVAPGSASLAGAAAGADGAAGGGAAGGGAAAPDCRAGTGAGAFESVFFEQAPDASAMARPAKKNAAVICFFMARTLPDSSPGRAMITTHARPLHRGAHGTCPHRARDRRALVRYAHARQTRLPGGAVRVHLGGGRSRSGRRPATQLLNRLAERRRPPAAFH